MRQRSAFLRPRARVNSKEDSLYQKYELMELFSSPPPLPPTRVHTEKEKKKEHRMCINTHSLTQRYERRFWGGSRLISLLFYFLSSSLAAFSLSTFLVVYLLFFVIYVH
jgi:hypothetical protein